MSTPIDIFSLHIIEVKKLNDIFQHSSRVLTPGIDINGLLRAELVFAVSALDQYIHSVVLSQAIDILKNNKTSSPSFSKLVLGLDSVNTLLNNDGSIDVFAIIEQELQQNLSWKSFQHPDKISEALKIICEKKIWDEVSALMGEQTSAIREQLRLIVKRRDSIAHEADFDIVNQSQYPIDHATTKTSVNFIISIVYMIDSIVFDYAYDDVQTRHNFLT